MRWHVRPGVRGPVWAALAGCAAAVAVGVAWLWPALGRGQLLYRDFVQVPHPVVGPAAVGANGQAPRAVPLDAVTAVFSPVIPSGVQQQVMVLASVVAAGCGMAVLLRRQGAAAAVAAAVLTAWSPYAAQRLLIGQPPTLLGWAMVPWLVLAVRLPGSRRRRLIAVVCAALPAALTPFGGLLAAATVLVAWLAGADRRRRGRGEFAALAALAVAWCLPWVVAAVAGESAAGQREGARAFAVRAAGALGVADVVGGGGIWAPAAALSSRGGVGAVGASLAVVAVAVAVGVSRWRALPVGSGPRRELTLLLLALVGPPLLALLLAGEAGLAVWAPAQAIPGVGLVRDTHRLLGLSTLAAAALVGLGIGRLRHAVAGRGARLGLAAHATAGAAAVCAISLAVLGAPEAATRVQAAYRPVQFPVGWQQAVEAIGSRTTLVLPWQPFRRQAWAGEHPFLDPLPLALPGRTVASGELAVPRDGVLLRVGEGDGELARAFAAGDLAALRGAGVEAVAVWRGTPGSTPGPHGLRPSHVSGPLEVWLLDR